MLHEGLTEQIIGCAMVVHTRLGPGLLESVYQACLVHELTKQGLKVEHELPLPVVYDGIRLETGFRIDLLVEDTVMVELKAMEELLPVHYSQVLTYLRLAGKPVGLLLNFNVPHLRSGIKRLINTPQRLSEPPLPSPPP